MSVSTDLSSDGSIFVIGCSSVIGSSSIISSIDTVLIKLDDDLLGRNKCHQDAIGLIEKRELLLLDLGSVLLNPSDGLMVDALDRIGSTLVALSYLINPVVKALNLSVEAFDVIR